MAGSSTDISEHGIYVDEKKRRVRCNYCGKEVQGFSRLKLHLSGVRFNVALCDKVTSNVREKFRDMVMKEKPGLTVTAAKSVKEDQLGNHHKPGPIAANRVGEVQIGDCDESGLTADRRVGKVQMGNRHKCGRSQESSCKRVSPENRNTGLEVDTQDLLLKKARKSISRFFNENGIEFSAVDSPSHNPGLTAAKIVRRVQMGYGHKRRRTQDSSSKSVSSVKENTSVEADKQDLSSKRAQKCIGRYFYENSVDFSAADSPSLREKLSAMIIGGRQTRFKFPDFHDLNGWILRETLKEMEDDVKNIKDSWAVTGCSILLDAWVDQKGHHLVSFVADCPAGAVYLKSVDVSRIKNDVTALTSKVDRLVEEIGVHNVMQIIACSTSGWVGELGKSFAGDDNKVFWSVSISHCFELMLGRIEKMDSFGNILYKVNNISEFINNNPSILKLFKNLSHGVNMTVSSSEFEFVKPYLLLESIFSVKDNLAAMFASSGWNKKKAKTIFKLVNDSSFWESVEKFVKSTSPLIHGLTLFLGANNRHAGYVYEIMDDIKESIAKEFNHKELCYKAVWEVIDDVWNKYLHSPLHVTGYFLNPAAFYSTEFYSDPEVTTGLISSIFRIIKDNGVGSKMSSQLVMYTQGKDCFNEASQADQISDICPAEWWTQKASKHPELQSFAIKTLSQTCEGASRYKLNRNLAEKLLLTEGMSHCEKQHLEELAFVHYNLHLQSCKAKLSEEQ